MEVANTAITDPPLVVHLYLSMIERGAGSKDLNVPKASINYCHRLTQLQYEVKEMSSKAQSPTVVMIVYSK